MSIVYLLQIFAIIILVIFSIVFLILVIPFQVSFRILVDGTLLEAIVTFSILLGLLKGSISYGTEGGFFRLFLFWVPVHTSKMKEEKKEKEKETKEDEEAEDKSVLERFRSITSSRKLFQPIMKVLKAFLRHTHLRELEARIKLGLPDPSHTGMLCALFYPLRQMYYSLIPVGTFSLTPVFTEEVFTASLRGRITLRIIMILIPILGLFLKKDFRTLVRGGRKT